MTDRVRLGSEILDLANQVLAEGLAHQDVGRMRRVSTRAAQLLRITSELVVRGDWDLEVGQAWLFAGQLTLKGLRDARTH